MPGHSYTYFIQCIQNFKMNYYAFCWLCCFIKLWVLFSWKIINYYMLQCHSKLCISFYICTFYKPQKINIMNAISVLLLYAGNPITITFQVTVIFKISDIFFQIGFDTQQSKIWMLNAKFMKRLDCLIMAKTNSLSPYIIMWCAFLII